MRFKWFLAGLLALAPVCARADLAADCSKAAADIAQNCNASPQIHGAGAHCKKATQFYQANGCAGGGPASSAPPIWKKVPINHNMQKDPKTAF